MRVNAKQYNDFELLYMIEEDSKEALEIMFEKYKPLIYSRIKSFNIKKDYVDDFFQEGLIALYNAIEKFNPENNTTFTNFFDIVLQRRIMSVLRKNKKYFESNCICENVDIVEAYTPNEQNINLERIQKLESILSTFELEVFKLKYMKELKANEIATILNVNVNKIYNACDRIKLKASKT